MDDEINKQIELQNKITSIVKERQAQISELKNFYDYKNKKLYKDIIVISSNLNCFEELFSKYDYRMRVDNIMSLSLSISKILDLNNSIKTVLIGIKVFEEHENFLKTYLTSNKNSNAHSIRNSFIYKMFEKNDVIPIIKNDLLKGKFLNNAENEKTQANNSSYITSRDFYQAIYRNDGNFFTDFSKYLNFQMDSMSKNQTGFKLDDFSSKLSKFMGGSVVNYTKFYTRSSSSFDLDYSSVVVTSCDIFFMLYNKFMDKICYHPNLFDYIVKLDSYAYKYFIEMVSDDLQRLSEFIAKKEMDDLIKNLDKVYN